MSTTDLNAVLGNTDIYLVDQIKKNRYKAGDLLLDAGCGTGRNLHWFMQNNVEAYGIDADPMAVAEIKSRYNRVLADRFQVAKVEQMPFPSGFFDGIISSAVLHFAENNVHFFEMFDEMHRVLKNGGSLFIRMASVIGIEELVVPLGEGIYLLPDGSTRFLLTRPLLAQLISRHSFSYLEPFKTVNVNDTRCMSAMVLQKKGDGYVSV
jgi:ubiquinone/menaquinone biosynthesis C-methylase UbiE